MKTQEPHWPKKNRKKASVNLSASMLNLKILLINICVISFIKYFKRQVKFDVFTDILKNLSNISKII